MKLVEALKALQEISSGVPSFDVCLACGFTPLHLQTFFAAYLQQRLGLMRRVVMQAGLYGDALGNIERLRAVSRGIGGIILEWSDLDPRLGIRHLSGWSPRDLPDIVRTVDAQASRVEQAVAHVSENTLLVISPSTLPLPPISCFPGHQSSVFEADLRARMACMVARIARLPNVKVLSAQRLDLLSPPGQRLDVKSELATGFPYTMAHADTLAELLASLALPPPPKKGLITDLDDTLWRGILGDIGASGVSWHLDRHSHIHGLYQQMLHSLADTGVLIAVASKNDPSLVDEVFRREELLPLRGCLFPVEVSWGPKSEAVDRILRSWNVGADSVVFVDDSPMELAEVRAAFPELECLHFPKESDAGTFELFVRLRDLFGKPVISTEDTIRLESIRQSNLRSKEIEVRGSSPEEFLAQADAVLTLEFVAGTIPGRALELINKTNQFNLNGRRYTEGEWRSYLRRSETFLLLASYKDKYGSLGTIAVLAGREEAQSIYIDSWVMSCRAFSRRIEHRCLKELFDRFSREQIFFDFQATPRNGPLREFFLGILGSEPTSAFRIVRGTFEEKCPPLYHKLYR